ncbi:sec-independent protein translocase protein TatA [Microbacterium endophyticum]|uniref:Sec-independent protein translocase protein TatA n=1 Tax=Microbacterium endophyticum TaxID=1526412 RepID=A0A7W4V5R5_9MICO|nr:twin-arginine translocase TatA/TatE family subunit [Microbacterium endophyticum]MBB2976728.1 sec-independent protein translocase protein TatA [Microbacterium endophyticum]NIK36636.1 sec-independent protein translocase protein TatA [Microbacterium endophyticum]
MGNAFGWPHLLIILAVILLLFGAAKLPALAKSVGQSARVFKGEMKAMKDDDVSSTTVDNQSNSTESATTISTANPPSSGSPDKSA